MPEWKELRRLDGLFNLASTRSRPFLDRCSETKYLAVRDYNRATDETLKLAQKTLQYTGTSLESNPALARDLSEIKTAMETGQLDAGLIEALSNLRAGYIEQILRPAVRTYLSNEDLKTSDLDSFYEGALRIKGLLEVVQFLKRIRPALF